MADGRLDHQWSQTSHILAMLANTVRDPEERDEPYQPGDFNPRTQSNKTEIVEPKHEVGVLKCMNGGNLPVMKIKATKKRAEVTDGGGG
jgi:hypothetical protein